MTNSLLISMYIVDRSKRSCIWTGSFGMVRSSLPFSVKVITSNTWFNSTMNVPFLRFCYFIVQIYKTHRNFVLCVPWFPTNAPSKSQNYLHCCTMPSAGEFDYTSTNFTFKHMVNVATKNLKFLSQTLTSRNFSFSIALFMASDAPQFSCVVVGCKATNSLHFSSDGLAFINITFKRLVLRSIFSLV